MAIFATVNLRAGTTDLLPHLVDHVTRLGVDHLLVCINRAWCRGIDDVLEGARRDIPITANEYESIRTGDLVEDPQREVLLEHVGAGEHDWVMYLDLDEFPSYPVKLSEIIKEVTRLNHPVVKGRLVDRFAADGSFAPLTPTPSVGEQYPIACNFTGGFLGGSRTKVSLARRYFPLTAGHHNSVAAIDLQPPFGTIADYPVHHFKWRAGIVERINASLANHDTGRYYSSECRKLLNYLADHGKISLGLPGLDPQALGALTYP